MALFSRLNTPERANPVQQLAREAHALPSAMFNSRAGGVHHHHQIHGEFGTLEIMQTEQRITERLLSTVQHSHNTRIVQRQNPLDREGPLFRERSCSWRMGSVTGIHRTTRLRRALSAHFLMSCVCVVSGMDWPRITVQHSKFGVSRAPAGRSSNRHANHWPS
jgi:hypothetical protein